MVDGLDAIKAEWRQLRLYFVLVVLSLLLIVGGVFFFRDELQRSVEHECLTSYAVSEFNNIPLIEGEIIQEFTAEWNDLHIFYLWLKNGSSSDKGIVKIEIRDKDGKQYYEGQKALNELGDELYCWVGGMQNSLKKGKDYELIINTEGVSGNTSIQAVKDTTILDSMGKLSINGKEENNSALYVLQTYSPTTYSIGTVWSGLWVITVALGVVIIFIKNKVVNIFIQILIRVWGIVAAFLSIEILQENIEAIEIKYIIINCSIILGVYLILYSLLKYYAKYATILVCFIIGIANYYVKRFRGTELQILDIKSIPTAMSVAGNYSFIISPVLYTVIVIVVLTMGLMTLIKQDIHYKEKRICSYKKRVGAMIGGIILLAIIYNLYAPRENLDWLNWSTNFTRYGWGYANMIIQNRSKIQKPEGYSNESIQKILKSIVKEDNAKNVMPQNVIVIMNESLSDLGYLGNLKTNQDYMPFIHNLETNAIKGNLYVSTFGGGTAVTEYEFLTGNTEHFFSQGIIPYSSLCRNSEAGLCKILQAQGFYAVAMHPYGAKNWNRDKVYKAMNFDEFLSLDDYQGAERIRNFVSDKADYDKIIEYVENDGEDDKLFIFNVTMQNHGGYDLNMGKMDTIIEIENFESSVAETYLSLVYESDKAFEYLLDYFSEFDEPTMIVMFGDHMPALPGNVYDNIYGRNHNDLSAEDKNKKYTTPYIIWTNYESDFEKKEIISANYLGSYVLECAGLQMTEYNKFLLNLMNEIPAIGQYGYLDRQEQFVSYEESDEQIFSEYRILQYMRLKDRKSEFYNCFTIQN